MDRYGNGEWRVEYFDGDGGCYSPCSPGHEQLPPGLPAEIRPRAWDRDNRAGRFRLNAAPRGWLAIDPKGLIGERYFDYANILCNPDNETATMPGRLARQVRVIANTANLESSRLLAWVVAWASLSAAFSFDDGLRPDTALRIAEFAAAELNR